MSPSSTDHETGSSASGNRVAVSGRGAVWKRQPEGRGRRSAPPPPPAGEAGHPRRSQALLRDLFGPPVRRSFGVRYWDGTAEGPEDPDFVLHLREPGALRDMFLPPTERSLGEAYLEDRCDVEGDMEAAVRTLGPALRRLWTPAGIARLWPRLFRLPRPRDHVNPAPGAAAADRERGNPAPEVADREQPEAVNADPDPGHTPERRGRRHSVDRDTRAVRHHYDRGNAFYRLFLDPWMQYSCGYFREGDEDLAAAQEAKLDLICRRLDLEPGARLLDVGCGWGGLVRYAASRRGVRCTGLTLSARQAEAARAAIRADGLNGRCRIQVRDYRDLSDGKPYDAVVSVGMVEHVGHRNLTVYCRKAWEALRPGGLFLNQGIVTLDGTWPPLRRLRERCLDRWSSFIEKHVFPDGELVTVAERVRRAEAAGFETVRVESLREHYAETLRRWVERLERRCDEAVALAGRRTYRVWRAYMAGSAHGFASGRIGVVQELYRKPTGTTA